MARQPRIGVPGAAHHVTQRGNNRQDVFFVDDDRRVYLSCLKESLEKRNAYKWLLSPIFPYFFPHSPVTRFGALACFVR